MTEAQLIKAIQAGDKAAEAHLDRELRARFRGRLKAWLGPDDGDDAIQQLWVELVPAIRQNKISEPPQIWAYAWGIAQHIGSRMLKKRAREEPFARAA